MPNTAIPKKKIVGGTKLLNKTVDNLIESSDALNKAINMDCTYDNFSIQNNTFLDDRTNVLGIRAVTIPDFSLLERPSSIIGIFNEDTERLEKVGNKLNDIEVKLNGIENFNENVRVENTSYRGEDYYILTIDLLKNEVHADYSPSFSKKDQKFLRLIKDKGLVVDEDEYRLFIPEWTTLNIHGKSKGYTVSQKVSVKEYKKRLSEHVYEHVEFNADIFEITGMNYNCCEVISDMCEDLTAIREWESNRSKKSVDFVRGILDDYIKNIVINLTVILSGEVIYPYRFNENEDKFVFMYGIKDPYEEVEEVLKKYVKTVRHEPTLIKKMKSKIAMDNVTEDRDLKTIKTLDDDLDDVVERLVYKLLHDLLDKINNYQLELYNKVLIYLGNKNVKYLMEKGYFKFHLKMDKSKHILDKILSSKEYSLIEADNPMEILRYSESSLKLGKILPLPEGGYMNNSEFEEMLK